MMAPTVQNPSQSKDKRRFENNLVNWFAIVLCVFLFCVQENKVLIRFMLRLFKTQMCFIS